MTLVPPSRPVIQDYTGLIVFTAGSRRIDRVIMCVIVRGCVDVGVRMSFPNFYSRFCCPSVKQFICASLYIHPSDIGIIRSLLADLFITLPVSRQPTNVTSHPTSITPSG